MDTQPLLLEYLKVVLSPQVLIVGGVVWFSYTFKSALRSRLENSNIDISTPGGGRLQVSQPVDKAADSPKPSTLEADETASTFEKTSSEVDPQQTEALLNSWRGAAFTWEYRYLNYHLVPHTQQVLDWFNQLGANAVTYDFYDTSWKTVIPRVEERRTVYEVLASHYLILMDNQGLISISEKGKEYCDWQERWKPTQAA